MRSKTSTLLIILLLCSAMLFAGCAGDSHETEKPETDISESESIFNETESNTASSVIETEETESFGNTESTSDIGEVSSSSEEASGNESGDESDTEAPEFSVEEKDGKAYVKYSTGFNYSVSGHKDCDLESGKVIFDDRLDIRFDKTLFCEKFNRFTIYYSSNAPLKIAVMYINEKGISTANNFFLEAGENAEFSALISSYLDGGEGTELWNIEAVPCIKQEASFVIEDIKTEVIPLYVDISSDSQYYIEDQKYRIGVDLNWGGALTYVSDKESRVDGVENLINRHDTGRLVQQSYYGTAEVPGVYVSGVYGGVKCAYNPVQGGDMYNNGSRLIDIKVTDDSIYVKSQPKDWAHEESITPSYMENLYSFENGCIRVDNRFVDFFGVEHRYSGQEMPAFYTISYLDSFVLYNGSKPWTDGELSVYRGIDAVTGTNAGHSYAVKRSNTETWAAWVNEEDDLGIGLFVPNVDRRSAGRFSYDGSKRDDANSCNYMASGRNIKLVSFLPLEYSYLIATGSTEEIREAFKQNKDFAANEGLDINSISWRIPDGDIDMDHLDFTDPVNVYYFTNATATASYSSEEQAAALNAPAADPYVYLDFSNSLNELHAEDFDYIEIEYMLPVEDSERAFLCELFLCTGDVESAKAGLSVINALVCDGEYHTLRLYVGDRDFWSGRINKIRFDFFAGPNVGNVMYVKSFKLTN